jgi:hypothetical protein
MLMMTTTTVVVVDMMDACECEDGKTEVETMTEEKVETNVKSDAENIVEREFASLRGQLEEAEASKSRNRIRVCML